jgi:hypothetical protein
MIDLGLVDYYDPRAHDLVGKGCFQSACHTKESWDVSRYLNESD